ncbi:MAG: hypothetical protein MUF87_01995 [Anaerolineae bacterium]|nr:hypothetical protein [Anaerolineae bacterium]
MIENNDLNSVQTYRNLVLQYEDTHAQITHLLNTHKGGTEYMTEDERTHYRALAKRRDELFSEIRGLEQQLLDDDQRQQ